MKGLQAMKKQSLNALAASYRADLLYYIERAKLGKCPPLLTSPLKLMMPKKYRS